MHTVLLILQTMPFVLENFFENEDESNNQAKFILVVLYCTKIHQPACMNLIPVDLLSFHFLSTYLQTFLMNLIPVTFLSFHFLYLACL